MASLTLGNFGETPLGPLFTHLCSLLWSWRSGNKKKIQESLKTSSILQERWLLMSTNCYSDNGGQASKKIVIMSICWTISISLTSVRQIVSRTSINQSKIPQLQHTSSPHANSSKLELLERRSDGQCFALDKNHDISSKTKNQYQLSFWMHCSQVPTADSLNTAFHYVFKGKRGKIFPFDFVYKLLLTLQEATNYSVKQWIFI